MNKPKTEFICVYILQTMKNLLFVSLFFPSTLLFHENCSIFPAPIRTLTAPGTAVFGIFPLSSPPTFVSALTNSARAIFVHCYPSLSSVAQSLSNQFINRRLKCPLKVYVLGCLFFLFLFRRWEGMPPQEFSEIAITCCRQW